MLITPLPGADRGSIQHVLAQVRLTALALRGPAAGTGFSRLLKYLQWATSTADMLRSKISAKDIDRLVLTPRYQSLLHSCGTLAGTEQQGLVNGLVDLEVSERVQELEAAAAALEKKTAHWNGREWYVVADSSFYIQNPERLADADLHQVLHPPRMSTSACFSRSPWSTSWTV
ncbi:hypothetical protein [Streptomyces aureus]|uniref:hypothetical protein n=1 Tax=Streptomyces aureus TaxID=193461 RepID=UPI000A853B86|nr:hypothetical protein [Streptomyces aureus]